MNWDLTAPIYKNYKHHLLNKLIQENKDLAPQGSAEWLAGRTYNIGGSEFSVITKENPYSKIDNLVAHKVGFLHFNGNIATRWGKLFENNTTLLSEILFNIEYGIKETGSLEGATPNQRYSPDGLAVIKMVCCDGDDEQEEYCIVLFEFKSPYMSDPNGSIPKHYLPQVKAGLCSIPITDFALFINNMFRKCTFEDLGDSIYYDTTFHKNDEKNKIFGTQPLAFGLIMFYQTETQQHKFYEKYKHLIEQPDGGYESDTDESSDNDDYFNHAKKNPPVNNENADLYKYIYSVYERNDREKELNKNAPDYMRDFGKCYYSSFNTILQLYDDNYLSVEYCKPHILREYNNNTFLTAQRITCGNNDYSDTLSSYQTLIYGKKINNRPIIGYLPWKLFKSDIIYESRDETYVDRYADEIQQVIAIIKDINSKNTHNEKKQTFKEYFPSSCILKKI